MSVLFDGIGIGRIRIDAHIDTVTTYSRADLKVCCTNTLACSVASSLYAQLLRVAELFLWSDESILLSRLNEEPNQFSYPKVTLRRI